MNCKLIANLRILGLLLLSIAACSAADAQAAPSGQPDVEAPVSYSSISQLNAALGQMEQASQTTQLDLAKLRIERWKADGGSKRQAQGNVESIQRNLQTALPGMISDLRTAPESLASTFKLYRNLDALYDVFSSVVESAGAFGSKDEFQSLDNDLNAMEKARRAFADRMEGLAGAKEAELTRLHAEIRASQTAATSQSPKKVIVDDDEPVKKPVKKKPVPKLAAKPATPPATTAPAAKTQ
jgi:hypothetical protein